MIFEWIYLNKTKSSLCKDFENFKSFKGPTEYGVDFEFSIEYSKANE